MYAQERPGGPGAQVLTMRRLLIVVVSLVVLPAVGHAQSRGMVSGGGRAAFAAPAPRMAMHASPSASPHMTSGARVGSGARLARTRSGALVSRPSRRVHGGFRNNPSTPPLLSQDVPGLGFDYPHFAATHPEGDHRQDGNGQFLGAYFPFFGGGYYMPLFPDDTEDAPAADAQQGDTSQPTTEPAPDRSRYPEATQNYAVAQNYAPAPQPAPERRMDEYVFVRRDGTVFFAVAYTWENGTLRYITTEGVRHMLAGDKLDLDATQQFNEQRGLNFHLPA